MEKEVKKAQILIEALPYIREFSGKRIVIKYGGRAMTDKSLREGIAEDIVLMKYVGIKPVVVHGGGDAITAMMQKLGIKSRFIEGNRVTDESIISIVEMVLAGKINKGIVALINRFGGKAVGLEGKDGELILAKKCKNKNLGLVGNVEKINPALIEVLDRENFIPVIAPIATNGEGQTLNINADIVAAEIAGSLSAEKLIFLTDVEGILEDFTNKESIIPSLNLKKIEEMMNGGMIQKGMIAKVRACKIALEKGVRKIHIISGKISRSLLLEIFTNKGIGTQILP